jgi:hypothetical protein
MYPTKIIIAPTYTRTRIIAISEFRDEIETKNIVSHSTKTRRVTVKNIVLGKTITRENIKNSINTKCDA